MMRNPAKLLASLLLIGIVLMSLNFHGGPIQFGGGGGGSDESYIRDLEERLGKMQKKLDNLNKKLKTLQDEFAQATDDKNEVVTVLGDNAPKNQRATNRVGRKDWVPGRFFAPHGVCADQSGALYVMDWNATGRVSKLERLSK